MREEQKAEAVKERFQQWITMPQKAWQRTSLANHMDKNKETDIRQSYYDLGNLQMQREWIARQVKVEAQEWMHKKYSCTLPSFTNLLQEPPL